jgi:MYXO-CTERM domain-containing protein
MARSIAVFCVLFAATAAKAQIPVIPGLHGYGVETPAGRGGRVIVIDTLEPTGDGSIDACLRATGPRICVFEVSGTIRLTRNLVIPQPFVTVAGQTAPSPGILIRGGGISITTHDVLLQHLRIRPGDDPDGPSATNRDTFAIANDAEAPNNVVIDHCSLSWSTDELFSTWYETGDVTFRHLLAAEPLHDSIHIDEGATEPAPHGFGPLFGPSNGRVAGYGSLIAHGVARLPMSIVSEFSWVNNVHYDRLQMFTHLHNRNEILTRNSIVGNVYIEGNSLAEWAFGRVPITIANEFLSGSRVFVEDNQWSRMAVSDPWELVRFDGDITRAQIEADAAPTWPEGLVALPASETLDWVLENAGARPLDRDVVDIRIVNEVRSGTGSVINCVSADGSERCEANGGGWPTMAENRRTLPIPEDPNGDADGDGYTNVEEWLHAEAAALEPGGVIVDEGFIFSPDPFFGDRRTFTELNAARWRVVTDQGDLRYAITTSAYEGGAGSELGELAVIEARTYDDFELSVTLRSGDDASNVGADADIAFGYEGPGEYFYVMLNRNPGQSGIYRVSGGAREELMTYAEAGIPDFEYHDYALVHEAGRVIVSRDGATLFELELDVPNGAIGLGSFNDAVFFDDLFVRAPGDPEVDAGPSARDDGGVETREDAGPDAMPMPEGCSCRAGTRGTSPLALLIGLALVLARRRR